jgi:predicted dehydrogenase
MAVRILICGLGSVGRRHLRNLVALGQQDIVLYRTGKANLPDEDVADWPASDSLDQALERWAPDAAVVANPTSLHLATSLTVAEAGCHVLLEKPVADRLDGLDRLAASLDAHDRQALVGFQFRFHPGLQVAREVIESGALGTAISARAVWGEYLPDWHPWEDYRQSYSARADLGGGVLLTLCHPFDYLRWLFGEAGSVTAVTRCSQSLKLDVEDSADVLIRFQSGAAAAVHLDYHQRPAEHSLTVVGSRGTLRWDNTTGETRWWRDEAPSWRVQPAPDGFERNTMFMEEMRHFVDVVEGRAQPACGLDDGVQALRIALAARASSESGQRVDLD